MTDKELQMVKERTLYKNELQELKKQVLELEQDLNVKEYLLLKQELEEKAKNDVSIKIDREYSNNLLFEYERLSIREHEEDLYTSDVWIYRDLETKEYFCRTAYSVFKKISRSCILNKKQLEMKDYEFEKLREQFFEQLLNKPQEQVVWEMFENNKQLVKGRKHELLF